MGRRSVLIFRLDEHGHLIEIRGRPCFLPHTSAARGMPMTLVHACTCSVIKCTCCCAASYSASHAHPASHVIICACAHANHAGKGD